MSGQKNYWNQLAADKEFTTDFQLDFFAAHVAKDARILDVGCGYGRTLKELEQAGFRNLYGIDFAENMVARGRKLLPHVSFDIQCEEEKIAFPSGSFDACLLCAVLTCIPEGEKQLALVREINRVLRPGGLCYINDFLLNTDERNLLRYQRGEEQFGTYGVFALPEGVRLRHHRLSWIRELLSSFRILTLETVVYRTMNGHVSNGFFALAEKGFGT